MKGGCDCLQPGLQPPVPLVVTARHPTPTRHPSSATVRELLLPGPVGPETVPCTAYRRGDGYPGTLGSPLVADQSHTGGQRGTGVRRRRRRRRKRRRRVPDGRGGDRQPSVAFAHLPITGHQPPPFRPTIHSPIVVKPSILILSSKSPLYPRQIISLPPLYYLQLVQSPTG